MEKQYDLKDTADILGVKIRTLRDWIKKGKITAKQYSNCGKLFIAQSEIERIQKEMK